MNDEQDEPRPKSAPWKEILHLFAPGKARVRVWDTCRPNGRVVKRYIISKEMMSSSGIFLIKQAYRSRSDSAQHYARKWFDGRTGKEVAA